MISIFPFPQHRHMEYISLRWYHIPEFVAPIRMSLIEDAANKEATETIVPFGKVEVITSKMLRCHQDLVDIYLISVSQWPPICSICRKHLLDLSAFTTYYRVCNYINTTGTTSGAGSTGPSGAPEFTPVFCGIRVTRTLALYVCLSMVAFPFVHFSFGNCVVCSDIRILIAPLVSSISS
jgi:hypothetical protein